MDTAAIRKIKPYLEKKIIKGYTYYQLVRKARIDGKVKRVWYKHLGTAAAIERVYDERDNLIPNLKIKSFEYGRTAALINISEDLNFVDTVNNHINKKDLSLQIILYWHKELFESTKKDIAGKIRQHQVAIAGSKFMPPFPAEIYPLLREFFRWYDKNKNKNKLHPVELAALVHLRFVTIHPFTDGNGRISRLMMNFVLHKHKFPLLNIHYDNRAGYYNALERAQTKEQDNIFVQWFFKRYVKEHKRYMN